MLLVQARLRVWRRWIHVQSLLARVAKTPHPNDMLAMLAGTRSPLFKHGLLLTLQGGTYAANATSCASCPEGYYCSGAAPLPEICQDVSSYCPAGSSAPIIAKAGTYTNPKRTATIACEEGFYCSSGRRLKCPSGSYCPAGVSNHIVIRAGMYTNANRTNVSACEVNFYCADGVRRPCPANSFGGPNLTSIDGCKPEEVATTSIVLGSLGSLLLVAVIIVYVAWRRSKSFKNALKVLTNPLFLHASGFLMEIFDFLTDGVACANAINSTEPFFAPFRYYYLVFLVTSSIACIVSMYIRVHAMRFFWGHHHYIAKHRKSKRLSIIRDHMQRVVPVLDKALAAAETSDVLRRALKMLHHTKMSTYAQALVLCLEDVTMGALNFVLFTAMVNQPDVLIAVARDDAFRIWWISTAALLSGMNAVWKLSKVKDLPNVLNREKLIREEIEKREKNAEEEDDGSDASEAHADASSADLKRISISEVARRFARIPGNVGVGMTKAGVKAVFPKVYDYIKSREQTHRIVGLDEDPMDTMTAVSSSYTAESLEEFMYMVRMVDYTDALLAMGLGSTLDDIAATVASRGLKGKEDFMPRIEGMARSESIQIAAALKKYHNMKIEKNEKKVDAV